MIFGLIKTLVELLNNYFKWKSIEAEIRAKRIILDELDETEKYSDEINKQIQELRKAGNAHANIELDAHADRLRKQFTQRVLFSEQLSAYLPLFQKRGEDSNAPGDLQPQNK